MSLKKSSQAQPNQPGQLSPQQPVSQFDCPAWPLQNELLLAELNRLVASGDWARYHPEVLGRLRQRIADYLRCGHVRLVPSGSAGVEIALRATIPFVRQPAAGTESPAAAPPEVICPALDYPGNARSVRVVGGLPVLVDSKPARWTIDPDAVAAAATSRTVAVIASHLYGEIAAVDNLRQLCDANRWTLIEDVCQMPGGRLGNRPLGTFGHVAVWSFGGSKPLTAGCGGAITTNDDRIAQRLASYIDRPSDAYPLSPLQAAVVLPQWAALDELARWQNEKLGRLVDRLASQTPGWILPSDLRPATATGDGNARQPVYYKVPVTIDPACKDGGKMSQRIVDLANQWNIPAGWPFRIPGTLASSRGRVVSSQNAQDLASRSWLLDHRVLGADEAGIDRLADMLAELYRQAMGE